MLLLPGPEHRGQEYDQGLVVGGHRVMIVEEGNQGRGTAWCVWDGSIVLVRYLEAVADVICADKSVPRILELGAGTGLAGICTAVLLPRALVCLTDLQEVLDSLNRNVYANASLVGDRVSVTACDWTRPSEGVLGAPWDLVIATDVVWLEDLVEPFINTLDAISNKNPNCVILMSYQSRTRRVDDMLFLGLSERGFATQAVPALEKEPPRHKVQIFKIHK